MPPEPITRTQFQVITNALGLYAARSLTPAHWAVARVNRYIAGPHAPHYEDVVALVERGFMRQGDKDYVFHVTEAGFKAAMEACDG